MPVFFLCICLCAQVAWPTHSSFSWHSKIFQTSCLWLCPHLSCLFRPRCATASGAPSCLTHSGQWGALLPRINPKSAQWFNRKGSLLPDFTGMFLFVSNNKETSVSWADPARSLVSLIHEKQVTTIILSISEVKDTKRVLKQVTENTRVETPFILTQGELLLD